MYGTSIALWEFFFFQAEDGIRDVAVTGVQTCALPICNLRHHIRTRLEDGGNDSDRCLDLAQDEALVEFSLLQHAAERVRHVRYLFDAIDDISEFRVIEDEAFVQRFGNLAFCLGKIFLVRLENRLCVLLEGSGNVMEDRGPVRRGGQFVECLPRAFRLLSRFTHVLTVSRSAKNAILLRVMN